MKPQHTETLEKNYQHTETLEKNYQYTETLEKNYQYTETLKLLWTAILQKMVINFQTENSVNAMYTERDIGLKSQNSAIHTNSNTLKY